MTSQQDGSPEPVDLGKHDDTAEGGSSDAELDFDPYRFGLPDQPVPPEFAPPGYRPPGPPPQAGTYSPYGPNSPYGPGATQAGQTPPGPYGGPPPPGSYGPPQNGPYGPPPGPYGPQPPYPPAYGYPAPGGPPPGYPGYPPTTRQGNGKAITSLVLGILSIVLCWVAFFDFALAIPAFILGVTVLSNKQSGGRGMALSGLICAVIGAVLAIVLTVVYVHIEHECRGVSDSAQQQCFRDKL